MEARNASRGQCVSGGALSLESPEPLPQGNSSGTDMKNFDRITNNNGAIDRHWRELGWLAFQSIATGLLVSLVLALAVFAISFEARAADDNSTGQGTLFLRDDSGEKVQAPLLFTDVHMNVSGMVARVQVNQRFVNPTSEWREGVYVFPLSEKAAVDHLTMHIGERVIEGQIRERIEARRTYDNANAEGRKATLIEQERPNLFTTSVANIGPDEEIVVALEYEETLRYDDGSFRLRFPLAITPRYIPGAQVASGGIGWSPLRTRFSMPSASRRPSRIRVMAMSIRSRSRLTSMRDFRSRKSQAPITP
jgi:hypothetical protein